MPSPHFPQTLRFAKPQMPLEFTDFDVWTFRKDSDERWVWQRISPEGEVLISAVTPFATMHECVEDARRRGYRGMPEAVVDSAPTG